MAVMRPATDGAYLCEAHLNGQKVFTGQSSSVPLSSYLVMGEIPFIFNDGILKIAANSKILSASILVPNRTTGDAKVK
jgi:hypothetical protein